MNFYEHTVIAKQNLSQKDVDGIEKKYEELINNNSGKVLKIEKRGLLNFRASSALLRISSTILKLLLKSEIMPAF